MTTTTVQHATPELRQWIVAQAQAGCRPEDVLKAMCDSGWKEDVAIVAMEETVQTFLNEEAGQKGGPAAAAAAAEVAVATSLPEPALADKPSALLIDGHRVDVLASLGNPRVVVFGHLLTDAECEELVKLAQARLTRSETVDNRTGGSELNAARTSDGMFFERGENPLVKRIETRIATLLAWPLENGEGLQILRYRPGAEYLPHYDYFDPEQPGTPTILKRGGQRVASLVMYLNTPDKGGATIFPDVGFEVAPVRGNAVFFSYDRPHPSTKSLHGGAPVIEGEKWVATKWLRVGRFE